MSVALATASIEPAAEQVLRSLPMWFGQEEALLAYVRDTSTLPTFISTEQGVINGFVSLRQHFPQSAEIHCIAVHAQARGRGIGQQLLAHTQAWAEAQGVRFLQVKTLADSHPSPEYAQTRAFYERAGFVPLEVFATLWSPQNPCLQLIMHLPRQ